MNMIENLKDQFYNPPSEFTVTPFWFLNGDLNKKDILDKMIDFKSKGIDAFVIHPRIGLSKNIKYLSPEYMDFIKFIVQEAKRLDMKIVLYDEGMYPSGSAHGKVVENNPEYASRGLRMIEYECNGFTEIKENAYKSEKIELAFAVKKNLDNALKLDTAIKLTEVNGKISFTPKDNDKWSIIVLVSTFSKGTIRGIHFGEDDGEEGAPAAADLLNPDAMKKFIKVTYDAYYLILKEYFGKTIIAMFTDEPNVLGRCVDTEKIKPWTVGFLDFYKKLGNKETDLLSLWFDVGKDTELKRRNFKKAVNRKLQITYYKQISDWCIDHKIALTGHPEASDDIGLLKYFQIPGQDVVWRWVGPENNKAVTGRDSTIGKCSSDAARHLGLRRNSNECFGCCGPDGRPWEFTVDDMKWFMDWLFVRGVNKLYPHAFFYSIEGEKRVNERPPDVGPNNSWWEYYNIISSYAKRMSWILTDSVNVTSIAVLCEENHLPWHIVKPLYENQIEFNYLEQDLLLKECTFHNEFIKIQKQQYNTLIIEDINKLDKSLIEILNSFLENGGCIIIYNPKNQKHLLKNNVVEINRYEDITGVLDVKSKRDVLLTPSDCNLRTSHILKNGVDFYLMVNEGEKEIRGKVSIKNNGYFEKWDAWNGKTDEIKLIGTNDVYSEFYMKLKRRDSVIICVDKERQANLISEVEVPKFKILDIQNKWILNKTPKDLVEIEKLVSWTKFDSMKYFSGKITYETYINIPKNINYNKVELNLGEVFEIAEVYINDNYVGTKMWSPFVFDITNFASSKRLKLTAKITNSIANRISKAEVKSGILGPVALKVFY